MSDLFHKKVPDEFIARCFETMAAARQHTFQVLTKRPERVAEMVSSLPWPPNVWMGTSVENKDYTWRVGELARVPAKVRFLSVEPLLGPIRHSRCEGCIGSSWEASRAPEHDRCLKNGSPRFAINVLSERCRSSLSSGAGCKNRGRDESWTDVLGMKCLNHLT